MDCLTDPNQNPRNGEMISDMAVFLEWSDDDEGGMFTCRHFDTQTNNCTVYDQRPAMCRRYPYGEACSFEGCTYRTEER